MRYYKTKLLITLTSLTLLCSCANPKEPVKSKMPPVKTAGISQAMVFKEDHRLSRLQSGRIPVSAGTSVQESPVAQCQEDLGTYGRLVIKELGINVAVNLSKEDKKVQAITDAKDSAALLFDSKDKNIIADHKEQGFEGIKKAMPGETFAYMGRHGGRVEEYICTDIFNGHNTGKRITDEYYRPIEGDNPGGIITYTCNDSWKNITIVFWQKL